MFSAWMLAIPIMGMAAYVFWALSSGRAKSADHGTPTLFAAMTLSSFLILAILKVFGNV